MNFSNLKKATLALAMAAILLISTTGAAIAQADNIPEKNKEMAKKIEFTIDQMHELTKESKQAWALHDKNRLGQINEERKALEKQLHAMIGYPPKTGYAKIQMVKNDAGGVDPTFSISSNWRLGCDYLPEEGYGSGNYNIGGTWFYLTAYAPNSVSVGNWPACNTENFSGVAQLWIYDVLNQEWEGTGSIGNLNDYPTITQNFNSAYPFLSGGSYYVEVDWFYGYAAEPIDAYGYINP